MKKIGLLIILLIVITLPFTLWLIKETTPLEIVVVDKTVPKKDYREHNGLFILLNSKKIVKENGQSYDIGADYFGYDPYDQVPFPSYEVNKEADLLYIADSYGVYSDDLLDEPDGKRSKQIYGGMDLLEWNKVMESKTDTTTLIAEFNSFATPTDAITSDIMQKNLGVLWSGWTGRYFADLASEEIPAWMINNYEAQTNEKWEFEGSGLGFVNLKDEVVILDDEYGQGDVNFELTNLGHEKFETVDASKYMYWFDIISPLENSEILATYNLKVTEEGEKILQDAGIPTVFPAVVHQEKEKTYYFAGDYADFPNKALTRLVGAPELYKFLSSKETQFFWLTYFPMMSEILEEIKQEKER